MIDALGVRQCLRCLIGTCCVWERGGGGGEIVFFFFLFLGLCVIRARWWAKDFALAVRIAVALREGVGFRRIGG